MTRHLLVLACLAAVVPAFGCAMCDRCDDYNYGAYGGMRPRDDMQHGRVGSVFAPADSVADEVSPPAQTLPRGTPTTGDPPPEMEPAADLPETPTGHSARRSGWRPY